MTILCLLQKDNHDSIIATTTVTTEADGAPVAAEAENKTVKTLNKSHSEAAVDKPVAAPNCNAGTLIFPDAALMLDSNHWSLFFKRNH
jgi:hypothetical protein